MGSRPRRSRRHAARRIGRPELWFAEDLVECAAKVIARSADDDLHFVGRSPDSIYDLLSGALAHTAWSTRLRLLPLSMFSSSADRLSPGELTQIRINLAADGLSPHDIARRTRPVVFVDFVHEGGTFEDIFTLLRAWTAEDGAHWDVIRLKLRFVGITRRTHTSPSTRSWQQQAEWPAQLPSSAIVNVSIDARLWSYFADQQEKATISFRPQRWLDETVLEPARDDTRRKGLALAVALVEHGRRKTTCEALARDRQRAHVFRKLAALTRTRNPTRKRIADHRRRTQRRLRPTAAGPAWSGRTTSAEIAHGSIAIERNAFPTEAHLSTVIEQGACDTTQHWCSAGNAVAV